jgi:transcriptional regulator with XRE-family HTH domain
MMSIYRVGRTLRALRLRYDVKQAHLAELMRVSQTTVSRWERGQLPLSDARLDAIQRLLAKSSTPTLDGAIKRLVESSTLRVHIICDRTHRLLAASRPRWAQWCSDSADLLGRSLLCFASPQIIEAEQALANSGWYDGHLAALTIDTGPNFDPHVPIRSGRVLWERLFLTDGTAARLVTTIA